MTACLPGQRIQCKAAHPPARSGAMLRKKKQGEAPSDEEFLSTKMQKITLLEEKLEEQAQEIQLKDKKIAELEEKMKTLEEEGETPDSSTVEELKIRCLQLQIQVWEMEQFLSSCGVVWVGESWEQLQGSESLKNEEELPAASLWKPGESVVSNRPIDFDLILKNVKALNTLAGEGASHVEHTAGGARLRQPAPLPLMLYQNGVVMFRPYEDPSTRQCLQDIMDGYFPLELQRHFPCGAPLQVTDRRDVIFQERHRPGNFPGHGHVVGQSEPSKIPETTDIPGPQLHKFSRFREAISVQDSARAAQQGSDGEQSKEILVETPRLSALESMKMAEGDEASAPNICTLRIKSESGEQTYIVKMLFTETIGDLRQHLTHTRGGDSNSYEIISTFPLRVYVDNTRSLQDCGLTPSCSLLLRRRDPSQRRDPCCHEGTRL